MDKKNKKITIFFCILFPIGLQKVTPYFYTSLICGKKKHRKKYNRDRKRKKNAKFFYSYKNVFLFQCQSKEHTMFNFLFCSFCMWYINSIHNVKNKVNLKLCCILYDIIILLFFRESKNNTIYFFKGYTPLLLLF
jgi:hypothetical protein